MIDVAGIKKQFTDAVGKKDDVFDVMYEHFYTCLEEIVRLREADKDRYELRRQLEFIALQPCEKFEENGESHCDQTSDCITVWCYPCHVRKILGFKFPLKDTPQ